MVLISVVSSYLSSNKLHIVHPSSLSSGGEGDGGLSFSLNFKKGRAWQDLSPQISGSQRVVGGKNSNDFFQVVAVFT